MAQITPPTTNKVTNEKDETPTYYLMFPKIKIPSSMAKYADRYMCLNCHFFLDSRKQFRRHETLFPDCAKANRQHHTWEFKVEKRPTTAKRIIESEPDSDSEEEPRRPKRIRQQTRTFHWGGTERDPLNLAELISESNKNVHDKNQNSRNKNT